MSNRNPCGCGPQTGLLRYIKIPYAKTFYTACCLHDNEYEKGGTAQERKMADRALFCHMLRLIECRGYEHQPPRLWLMVTVALGYYIAVRLMGWRYWGR